MTRVLRPLKAGEGSHAPLCEMVESTQAQVYEALAIHLDDLMTPQNVRMFANGRKSGQYVVQLDDGRTVMTNPFTVEHPSESKECLDRYMAAHPSNNWEPERTNGNRHYLRGIAGILITGLVHIGISRHVPAERDIASIELKPAHGVPTTSSFGDAAIRWFKNSQ